MKRALFLNQFRRAVVPFGLVFISMDVAMDIFDWALRRTNKYPENLGQGISALLLLVATGIAIPMGATAFSRDFKERHHLFLHALPMRLQSIWAAIAGANFAALISCFVLLAVFRPSMLPDLLELPAFKDSFLPLIAFEVICICFLAGSCFSLCFRRDLAAYLFAFFALGPTIAGIAGLAAICAVRPGSDGGDPHRLFAAVALICPAVLLALLSRKFFVDGEVTLVRVQFRNAAMVLGGLLGILVTLSAGIQFGLFARFNGWVSPRGYAAASPGGKYIMIVERRGHHPEFGRLTILDAGSGKILKQREYSGLETTQFGPDDLLTMIHGNDLPLSRLFYLLPRSDSLVRVALDGEADRETVLPSTRIFAWQRQGGRSAKMLIIGFQNFHTRVFSLDTSNGELANACAGESSNSWAFAQAFPNGSLVCLTTAPEPPAPASVWWLGETEEKKLPWAGRAASDHVSCVVRGFAFAEPETCVQRLRELFPAPPGKGPAGAFLANGLWQTFYVGEKSTVFYLQPAADTGGTAASLLAWSDAKKAWTTVAEKLPQPAGPRVGLESGLFRTSHNPVILEGRIALYHQKTGEKNGNGYATYLYDGVRGESQKLGAEEDSGMPSVSWTASRSGLIISVNTSGGNLPAYRLRYDSQSGKVIPLSIFPGDAQETVLFADETGIQLVSRHTGVYRRNRDGSEVRLWPPPGATMHVED